MQILAVLECPTCYCARPFADVEGLNDVHLSRCVSCGYQFGYANDYVGIDKITREPVYEWRPVLSAEVAQAGIQRRNDQRMAILEARQTTRQFASNRAQMIQAQMIEDPSLRGKAIRNLVRSPDGTRGPRSRRG